MLTLVCSVSLWSTWAGGRKCWRQTRCDLAAPDGERANEEEGGGSWSAPVRAFSVHLLVISVDQKLSNLSDGRKKVQALLEVQQITCFL